MCWSVICIFLGYARSLIVLLTGALIRYVCVCACLCVCLFNFKRCMRLCMRADLNVRPCEDVRVSTRWFLLTQRLVRHSWDGHHCGCRLFPQTKTSSNGGHPRRLRFLLLARFTPLHQGGSSHLSPSTTVSSPFAHANTLINDLIEMIPARCVRRAHCVYQRHRGCFYVYICLHLY